MGTIRLSLLVAVSTIASLVAVQALPAGAQTASFGDGSVHYAAGGSVPSIAGSSWSITDGTSNILDGTSNTFTH